MGTAVSAETACGQDIEQSQIKKDDMLLLSVLNLDQKKYAIPRMFGQSMLISNFLDTW